MFHRFVPYLVLCLPSFLLAQNSTTSASTSGTQGSSVVQVVYVINNSTLTTYDVNPQTLEATQVGTNTMPQSTYGGVTTSPNGRFMYYTQFSGNSQPENVYVYETKASGVPNTTPLQTLTANGLQNFVFDPVSNFVYASFAGPQGSDTTHYAIMRYVMDPATGRLTQPVVEATYSLASSEGGLFCSLGIMNVNPAGTELYDQIPCSEPFSLQATYNERAINTSTGALGPDVQIYFWNNHGAESAQTVSFVKNLMFDFVTVAYKNDANQANIYYPIQPNETAPLISCGTDQYAPCGDFVDATVNPSGQYVFLTDPTSTTYIVKVNLTSRRLLPQSSSIPYEVQEFSPDGDIAYGVNDVNGALEIEIYAFNVSNGDVTQGGTISVPSDLDSWWTAQRN
jgi:hypothetical protein